MKFFSYQIDKLYFFQIGIEGALCFWVLKIIFHIIGIYFYKHEMLTSLVSNLISGSSSSCIIPLKKPKRVQSFRYQSITSSNRLFWKFVSKKPSSKAYKTCWKSTNFLPIFEIDFTFNSNCKRSKESAKTFLAP